MAIENDAGTLSHEIGHALGLTHPDNTHKGESGDYGIMSYSLNRTVWGSEVSRVASRILKSASNSQDSQVHLHLFGSPIREPSIQTSKKMKSKVLIIVFLSLSVHLSCQPYMAEKVRTKGVIITRYSMCGDSSYVEMGSRILIKDSLYVFLKHRDNTIIKDNIYLLNDLGGEIKDYGEVFMLSDDHSIVNNLMLCPYDSMFFSKNEGHSFVSARGGFYIRDTVSSDLYAVYNFEGVVILYHGKWPFHSDNTPKEVWEEFGIEYNCGCPEKERHDTIQSFVILLQTVTVSMYNPDLQDKLDLHSTNTNRIPIIFCEM